ncbi:MAG: hypothetical protein IJ250_04290 [Bacteroidales bacterium]|nr:hypothetical protein [Bacteroidales bacterium]
MCRLSLKDYIDKGSVLNDYPVKGVNFLDIMPLLQTKSNIVLLQKELSAAVQTPVIALAEARGFLFGGLVLNGVSPVECMIPFRKTGKLPPIGRVYNAEIEKEYGTDVLQYRETDMLNAKKISNCITVFDDVLATGGTARQMALSLKEHGFVVEKFVFVTKINGLQGMEQLKDIAPAEIIFDNNL